MTEALARADDFRRLKRDGWRVRHDVMSIVAVRDPVVAPPRVGYSISRRFGSAVRRNRARRRLRALCDARARDGRLGPGLYLISPNDAVLECDHVELSTAFDDVLERIPAP